MREEKDEFDIKKNLGYDHNKSNQKPHCWRNETGMLTETVAVVSTILIIVITIMSSKQLNRVGPKSYSCHLHSFALILVWSLPCRTLIKILFSHHITYRIKLSVLVPTNIYTMHCAQSIHTFTCGRGSQYDFIANDDQNHRVK